MVRFPGLGRDLAKTWLHDGRVAILLDGLDEFNDEQRPDLVQLLNSTFLFNFPELCVAVCSRTNEYHVLQNHSETKLQLRGCVHLEPLTERQIILYLQAADAQALLKAIPNDAALRQLAQTPLTLSMLVLAYGGIAPAYVPSSSLTESRHRLFQAYVARMLQRQARRLQDVPFDDIAAHDIPNTQYLFPPAMLDRWLSWLALTMSVRMRTTFSIDGLLRLLLIGIKSERRISTFYCSQYTLGIISLFSSVLFGLLLLINEPSPQNVRDIAMLGGVAVVSSVFFPFVSAEFNEKAYGIPFAILAIIIEGFFSIASASRLTSELLPNTYEFLSYCAIFTYMTVLYMVTLEKIENPKIDIL